MANTTTQYYVTESEVSKLLKMSGLPENFQNLFAKDYVALKSDTETVNTDVDSLSIRVSQTEDSITIVINRVNNLDSDVSALQAQQAADEVVINNHISASSAHGATGNIVGTDDYCSTALGGTVLEATAVPDVTIASVSVSLNPNSAAVIYSQTDAATWVAMLNEHKAAINSLSANLDAANTTINSMLASDRAAKQREP